MRIHDTYCNLGKDPEYKVLANGTPVVNFTVAVSNDYKPKDSEEWVKRPASWYNCKAFGAVADQMIDELSKGSRIKIIRAKYERTTTKKEDKFYENNDVNIFEYEVQHANNG